MFLDNVVTSILVFEDDGQVHRYPGGYSDWLKRGHQLAEMDDPDKAARKAARAVERAQRKKQPQKLAYKEQRELDGLPQQIETLESRIATLQAQCSSTDFYNQSYDQTQPILDDLSAAQLELHEKTERWLALEELQNVYADSRSGKA